MQTDAQTLRNLCSRIASVDNLSHRVSLELFAKIKLAHVSLPASNLGKKMSTNLGAIQLHLIARTRGADLAWYDYGVYDGI